jgi:4-diphosphocytidyl-2-C-methyl-D-erythritol kinase
MACSGVRAGKPARVTTSAAASITLAAPAKINLHLEVLGRRGDGFHELETVFQTLELADTLTVSRRGTGVELRCSDPRLPSDAGNLAYRAATAYLALRPDFGGVAIDLTKRIPHGAGLGGGSSDAAAVLRACQRLDPTPLPAATLARLGLELGSDVPVFLLGGTAYATGRGEVLTALADRPVQPVTVLMPEAHLPTPAVFKALTDAERGPRPAQGAAWAAQARIEALLANRLTAAASRLCPPVAGLLAWLAGQGVPYLMSGSGAACFALGDVAPPPGVTAFVTAFRPRDRLDTAG